MVYGVGADGFNGALISGVEFAGYDSAGGVKSAELADMCVQVGGAIVAEVEGCSAVGGEVVSGCAADP